MTPLLRNDYVIILRNSQKLTHINPIPESYRPNIYIMTQLMTHAL